MDWTLLILLATCALILAWNLYPPFRARMKGLSTVLEPTITAALYYMGVLADGIREAQDAGYLPENLVQYVPFILTAYIIVKRLQTTTPVGQNK